MKPPLATHQGASNIEALLDVALGPEHAGLLEGRQMTDSRSLALGKRWNRKMALMHDQIENAALHLLMETTFFRCVIGETLTGIIRGNTVSSSTCRN